MVNTSSLSPQIDSNFTLNNANSPPTINATITLTDVPENKLSGVITDVIQAYGQYLVTLNSTST